MWSLYIMLTQEGIDFDHIPYFDNTTVLKLLDNAAPTARGIFQVLPNMVILL